MALNNTGKESLNIVSLQRSQGSADGRSIAAHTNGTEINNTIDSVAGHEKESDSDENDELKEL